MALGHCLRGGKVDQVSSQSRHYTALWYADTSVIKVGMDLQERKRVARLRPLAIVTMGTLTPDAT
jgi:hypothetical protein